jgi:hypothetical protein
MGTSSAQQPLQFPSKNRPPKNQEPDKAPLQDNTARCPLAEHRRQPRSSFTASATIMEPDSGTRVEAHTTDLCLGGCYVDTMNAFPLGTIVELRLTNGGKAFESIAKVVYSLSGVGMGLAFRAVEQDQFLLLERWYAESRGERVHEPHLLEQEERRYCGPAEKSEDHYALEELLVKLMHKGVLTEEEGEPILLRLLR